MNLFAFAFAVLLELRWMEWARGCWIHQKKFLETESGLSWMCASFTSMQTRDSEDSREWMAGTIHQAGYKLTLFHVSWQVMSGCEFVSLQGLSHVRSIGMGAQMLVQLSGLRKHFKLLHRPCRFCFSMVKNSSTLVSNQLVASESGKSCSCLIE